MCYNNIRDSIVGENIVPHSKTNIEVTPGTSVHSVVVEESKDEHTVEQPSIPERRKATAPVNVNLGQSVGGLTGLPATIANFSAVGFVMVMMYFIYQDFKTNVRDNQTTNRE